MVIKLYIAVSMKVLAENYKGIEFVRLSRLPVEQRSLLTEALPSDKIIKILRENELLTDCVQYKHYDAWFNKLYKPESAEVTASEKAKTRAIKLVFD